MEKLPEIPELEEAYKAFQQMDSEQRELMLWELVKGLYQHMLDAKQTLIGLMQFIRDYEDLVYGKPSAEGTGPEPS
jgi:hypothetical protein